jgi:hypothetical protein
MELRSLNRSDLLRLKHLVPFDKLWQVLKMSQPHCRGFDNSRHFGSDRPSTNFPYTLRMIQTIKAITNSVPSSPYPNMVDSNESFGDRNILGQRKVRVCALSHVLTRLAGERPRVRTEEADHVLDNDLA